MFRFLIIALLLPVVPNVQVKDNQCKLTAQNTPVIRQFRTGMDLEAIYKLIPPLRFDDAIQKEIDFRESLPLPDIFTISVPISGDTYKNLPLLNNLEYLQFSLFEKKVQKLYISYKFPTWDSPKDFLQKLRESVAFPEDEFFEKNGNEMTCRCDGVRITVGTLNFTGTVTISDDRVYSQREEARKKVLLEARRNFKP